MFSLKVYAEEEWRVQTHDDLIKYRGECVTALSISDEQVAKYRKWEFSDDETTHKYISCVFVKMGLFQEEKGFIVEHLVKQLAHSRDAAEVETEVTKCAEKKDATSANWAYKGFACFRAAHLDLIQMSVKETH